MENCKLQTPSLTPGVFPLLLPAAPLPAGRRPPPRHCAAALLAVLAAASFAVFARARLCFSAWSEGGHMRAAVSHRQHQRNSQG